MMDRETQRELDRLERRIEALRLTVGNPPVRETIGGGSDNVAVQQFQAVVYTETNNYVGANTWDGTTRGQSLILIAKPVVFRGSSYPVLYVENQLIYATKVIGGTSVSDGSGNPIPWLDIGTIYPVGIEKYKVLQGDARNPTRVVWDWVRAHA